MTRQDRLVLKYLTGEAARKYVGRMPTYKEACADLDMHRGQLQRHLRNLVDEGLLICTTPHTIPYKVAILVRNAAPSPERHHSHGDMWSSTGIKFGS